MSASRLSVRACVRACSAFHIQLSHPLRTGRGGMLSEPECPSFLRRPALPGNKTKTTGFHSMKQSTGSLLRDLLHFQVDWQENTTLSPQCSLVLEMKT